MGLGNCMIDEFAVVAEALDERVAERAGATSIASEGC